MRSFLFALAAWAVSISSIHAATLVDTIKANKASIVGIGLYTPLDSNASQLRGTGFIFGDGKHIATNYHVVSEPLDPAIVQHYVAMIGQGESPQVLKAEVIAMDPVHDIAILRIGQTFPALKLAADELLPEGTEIAFTGFPIGAVLGLYPATHKGIIAAIAPDVIPSRNADQLTIDMLSRLKKPFMIYQLDATAYPGNSGSPVYDIQSRQVIAVINKVFVAQGKEAALTNPSGISYAIPIMYLKKLAQKHQISV